MFVMQGCTIQQEGYGVTHLDPLHPDLKFSNHSLRLTRDEHGIVRIQFKQYMRDHEWRPEETEGHPNGHRLFRDTFDAQDEPDLEPQRMTVMQKWPEVFVYLQVILSGLSIMNDLSLSTMPLFISIYGDGLIYG